MRFYRSLNELPLSERPQAELLDDDAALDKWYDGYVTRHTQNTTSQIGPRGIATPTRMFEE